MDFGFLFIRKNNLRISFIWALKFGQKLFCL